MATRLYDGRGRPVGLGREVGRGGEGAVWDVAGDPGLVAKVYHRPVDPDKVDKLAAMARLARPDLLKISAWPTGTLHDAAGGRLVGILLPKVVRHAEVHQLYSPAERKIHYPKADWSFLAHVAMNCAAAFETVHAAGHVIGDVNPGGVMVSHQATVHLIDCDSFQVRDNGRLFPCLVGVPQYTPPELQGVNFHGALRTRDHDCFGLALLVFHLLFMGRHPFAGRFSGAGDMPIEQAISEGRFAFSRSAAAFHMTAPPHSIGLHALSPQLAAMFERAFTRQGATARPSSAEWRDELALFKKALRQCPADSGHKYSAHLSICPWCDIVRHGGPNFFISIQVVIGGVTHRLPPFDVATAWAAVEAIPRLATGGPSPTAARCPTPLPLPQAARDALTFIRVVRVAFIIAMALLVPAGMVGPVMLIAASIVGVVLGGWWALLVLVSPYTREIGRRRAAHRTSRAALAAEQRRRDTAAEEYTRRFDALKSQLASARDRAAQLPADFERERRDLEARRRDAQLQSYLESQFIRNHKIDMIGPGRLLVLQSNLIETAADVDERKLADIQGFGPATIARLVAWKQTIVSTFRFDPTQAVSPTQAHALYLKYRQQQQSCEAALTQGRDDLRAVAAEAAKTLGEIDSNLQRLAGEFRRAEANLCAA